MSYYLIDENIKLHFLLNKPLILISNHDYLILEKFVTNVARIMTRYCSRFAGSGETSSTTK